MAEGGKLSHSVLHGSADYYDPYCSLCDDDGLNVEAVGYCTHCRDHLCQTCFAHHCKPKPLRHHKLLGKDAMPTSMTTKGPGRTRVCSDKCPNHEERLIRFYCQEHENFACTQCAVADHKDCKIQHIPEESKKIFDGFEIKMMHASLQTMMDHCQRVTAGSEHSLAKTEEHYTKLRKSLRDFRRLLNTTLDYLEKDIEAKAKEVKTEDKERIKLVSQKCVACSIELTKIQNTILALENEKKHCDMFLAMKKARRLMERIKQSLNKAEKENEARGYRFKPSVTLQKVLTEENALGELLFTHPNETAKDAPSRLSKGAPSVLERRVQRDGSQEDNNTKL